MDSSAKDVRSELSLLEFLQFVWPQLNSSSPAPRWPPDVFGLAASALKKAGAYENVVMAWPPSDATQWIKFVKKTAAAWRAAWEKKTPVPADVESRWATVVGSRISLVFPAQLASPPATVAFPPLAEPAPMGVAAMKAAAQPA